MKHAVTLMLMIAVALPEAAADRRAQTPPPDDTLTIAFVAGESSMTPAGSDAWLDLKQVSGVTHTRRRFGVKVVSAGRGLSGAAVITVSLSSYDGRAKYRLDGKLLTSMPVVVDAHASVGAVVFHTLDVEVPASVAEGPLAASITWEVTAE